MENIRIGSIGGMVANDVKVIIDDVIIGENFKEQIKNIVKEVVVEMKLDNKEDFWNNLMKQSEKLIPEQIHSK